MSHSIKVLSQLDIKRDDGECESLPPRSNVHVSWLLSACGVPGRLINALCEELNKPQPYEAHEMGSFQRVSGGGLIVDEARLRATLQLLAKGGGR